jgi:hypothetical protein
MSLEARLRNLLVSFKGACERLEELLAREECSVNEVLDCLYEIKERISSMEALLLAYLVEARQEVAMSLIEFTSAITSTSLSIELDLARLVLQGASAVKKIKVEDFKPLLDLVSSVLASH